MEGYVGGFGDIGSFGIPKISFGLSINLHDSYIENDNSVLSNSIPGGLIQNLGGTSKTYSRGLVLTGGYSYSSNERATEKSDYGVETKSIGLGLGINAQKGMSRSWTFTEIYNNMKK
jgi:hypothetical protein